MSLNNILPWWVYEGRYERQLALMSCCFYDELYSGTFKVTPDHIQYIHPSNFESWDEGGWNHGKKEPKDYHQLKHDIDL